MRNLGLLSILLTVGCLATGSEPEVDDAESKEDGVTRPHGTYVLPMERTDDSWGGIYLSLMSDRSFRLEEDVDPFIGATVERGTYRFTRSGAKRFIKLTNDDGSVTRYQYKLSGGTLELRADGVTAWAKYEHDELARCDTDEDCLGQGVPEEIGCYYSACVEVPEPDFDF